MPTLKDGAMTAETMQPEDFEARVTKIVNRILARRTPRLRQPAPEREIVLAERFVRVEEELKHQRELMLEGFARSDKRFAQIDKHFELVDKRFAELRQDMLTRFEQVDKRFAELRQDMDRRFEESRQDMLARFEQVDKRFELVDKRFEQIDNRLDHQLGALKWSIGLLATLFIGLSTIYKFIV